MIWRRPRPFRLKYLLIAIIAYVVVWWLVYVVFGRAHT